MLIAKAAKMKIRVNAYEPHVGRQKLTLFRDVTMRHICIEIRQKIIIFLSVAQEVTHTFVGHKEVCIKLVLSTRQLLIRYNLKTMRFLNPLHIDKLVRDVPCIGGSDHTIHTHPQHIAGVVQPVRSCRGRRRAVWWHAGSTWSIVPVAGTLL